MQRWWVFAMIWAACGRGGSARDWDPATMAQATEFAPRLAETVARCDREFLATLVDDEALATEVERRANRLLGDRDELIAAHPLAAALCPKGTIVIDAAKVLHVRMVDGQARPLIRMIERSAPDKPESVAYVDLALGVSHRDHAVRVVDMFSLYTGQWVSQTFADLIASMTKTDDTEAITDGMTRATSLARQGKAEEALRVLDGVPLTGAGARVIAIQRVNIAQKASKELYLREIDKVRQAYPDDPTLALLAIDGAFMRNDLDEALRDVDLIDRAVGGDPFQDAIRVEAYLKRGRPGDLDLAKAHAAAAIAAEPGLAKARWAMLDVAMARQEWSAAVEQLEFLTRYLKVTVSEEKMRAMPSYAGLLASPEYAAWRAKHP